MILNIVMTVATPIVMEVLGWLMHRYLFHGPLWVLHKDHHLPSSGFLEKNDLFSSFFAGVSMVLIISSAATQAYGLLFSIGLGMAIYGFFYFWIHDGLAHKRWKPPSFLRPKWAELVKKNHRFHHQKVTKDGQGPYGLFF